MTRPSNLAMPPPQFAHAGQSSWSDYGQTYQQPFYPSPDQGHSNHGQPFVHPQHFPLHGGYMTAPNSVAGTPSQTPGLESTQGTSTGGSGWNGQSYFADEPISQQLRPRRAQSVSSFRHSPYPLASPHTSPSQQHMPSFFGAQKPSPFATPPTHSSSTGHSPTAVIVQACERLSSAAQRLDSMAHAAVPTMSKAERDEVEAMLDAAMADLKATFFGSDNASPLVKRRHAGSISNHPALQREELQTSGLPPMPEPPPLLHSQSTPVVPTYGNGAGLSNTSLAIAGLHHSSTASSNAQPSLAALMQETANNPSLLSEPLQMPSKSAMAIYDAGITRSVPATPGPSFNHSPLVPPNPFSASADDLVGRPAAHRRSSSSNPNLHVRTKSGSTLSALRRLSENAVVVEGDGSIVHGSPVPNLSDAMRATLDAAFQPWLQTVCKDVNMTDAKGEPIHQTLMAKKMSAADNAGSWMTFKFRIQAFTNRLVEDLAEQGIDDSQIPYKTVRMYLWQHPLVGRYNADGRKSKSKGNHVWAVEARKTELGEIIFRPFARRIILPDNDTLVAVPGQRFHWEAHIFDPHAPGIAAEYSSPPGSLPDWLEWRRPRDKSSKKKKAAEDSAAGTETMISELSGDVPAGLECTMSIPVHASFTIDGEALGLDTVVQLNVGSPSTSTLDFDMADSDEDDGEGDWDATRPGSPVLAASDPQYTLPALSTGSSPTATGPSPASAAAVHLMSAFGVPASVVDGIAQVMDVAKARLEPDGQAAVCAQASNNAPAAAAVEMVTNPVQLFIKEQSITQATQQIGPIQAALIHQAEVQREYDTVASMEVPPLVPAAQQKVEHLQHLGRACDQARVHVADVISIEQSRAIEQVARDPIAAAAALTAVDSDAAQSIALQTLTGAAAPPPSNGSSTGTTPPTPVIPTSSGPPLQHQPPPFVQ